MGGCGAVRAWARDDAMAPLCWNAAAIEQMKAGTADGMVGGFERLAISYVLAGDNPHLMVYVDHR